MEEVDEIARYTAMVSVYVLAIRGEGSVYS